MRSFVSPQQCCRYLQFWTTVACGLGIFCCRPGSVLVNSLVRAIYGVLPANLRLHTFQNLPDRKAESLQIILGRHHSQDYDTFIRNDLVLSRGKAICDTWIENRSSSNLYLMVSFFFIIVSKYKKLFLFF